MINLPKYIFNFIILILVQVLLLNNIEFSGIINPYLYVLFILILPFNTPKWLLLVLASLLGLSIDLFMNTPGINMAATVFMAYLRPRILMWVAPRDNYEVNSLPTPSYYGFEWFLKYAVILIFAQHLCLFIIEDLTFSHIFNIVVKTILSTLFTLIFITITLMFTYNKKRKNY